MAFIELEFTNQIIMICISMLSQLLNSGQLLRPLFVILWLSNIFLDNINVVKFKRAKYNTKAFIKTSITLIYSYLCVRSNPVRGLRIVVALLNPALEEVAFHRIMPVLSTIEAEYLTALAHDRPGIWILHLNRIVAVRVWTPAQ